MLPTNSVDLVERVRHVLDVMFGGNQSRMAAELALSQSVVSRVVAGKASPGRALMEALARHPKLNPRWIMRGEGEPFLQRSIDLGGNWTVPVAICLLPGSPESSPQLLSTQMELVDRYLCRPTVYAIRAGHAGTICNQIDHRVYGNDRLFIDTDPSMWNSNPVLLDKQLCVVRVRDEPPQFDLERVFVETLHNQIGLKVASHEPKTGREQRVITLDELPDSPADDYKSTPKPTGLKDIAVENIVGVIVRLHRNLWEPAAD